MFSQCLLVPVIDVDKGKCVMYIYIYMSYILTVLSGARQLVTMVTNTLQPYKCVPANKRQLDCVKDLKI